MSTAEGWDLLVPEDDAELLAELRRHGVHPGQRLHVAPAVAEPDAEGVDPPAPSRRHLSFAGSFEAEPDLAERTDHYLSGFGRE